MDITFIGSGNVASHLAPALDNIGHSVRKVYSKSRANAEKLVSKLYHSEVQTSTDFSNSTTPLFIIAIADDAIEEVTKDLTLPHNAILVHTSGTKVMKILDYAAVSHTGVFYPLQTFSKTSKINLSEVPFLIEGSDAETEKTLVKIARSLSNNVKIVNSENRKTIHLGAVFANNFINHMLTVSKGLMEKNDLPFDLLKPLIIETINKAMEMGPDLAQTGPAIRQDLQTLDLQMDMIDDDNIREIYKLISQNILDHYS